MSSSSYHFVPGASDAPAAPAAPAPAAPAQPNNPQPIPGSGALRYTFGAVNPSEGKELPEDMDRGVATDESGNVRIKVTDNSRHQSFTFTPDSFGTTSFVSASGLPVGPNEATHVKIPRGDGTFDMTSVQAAQAMGLVVKTGDGWAATGRAMRNGQVFEQDQLGQVQQQDAAQARIEHVKSTIEALRNMHGEAAFNKMVSDHFAAGYTEEQFFAAILGQPAGSQQPQDGISPELRAFHERSAQLARQQQQAQPQQPQDPAAHVPQTVDVRVPALAAKESALTEGASPSAVTWLKSRMAGAIASGDENTLQATVKAYAMETGISEGKAQEVMQAVGHSIGAPLKVLAARVGVQPQQLLSHLQAFDAEALGAALSQVAQSRNGSKLVQLTTRALAAARRAK